MKMLDEIIGRSPAIEKFRSDVTSLAQGEYPLLFVGEAGVGKSLLASHLHAQSPYSSQLVGMINFTTLSEKDQRVKLFGAEPPELTTSRRGILELPTTILLKHVQSAPPYLQDQLADSIQSAEVCRWRGSKMYPIRGRIIFTLRSSPSLLLRRKEVSPKLFEILRRVRKIVIPPLRIRKEDIPLIASYYIRKFQHEGFSPFPVTSFISREEEYDMGDTFSVLLQEHQWEENVRDLRGFIRGLCLLPLEEELCEYEKVELMKMIMMVKEGKEFSLSESLAKIGQGILTRAMRYHYSRQVEVAQSLGMTERAVRRLIAKFQGGSSGKF